MSHVVSAEIVANVMSIEVEVGATVKADDALLVLESMKMEIPVLAEVDGTVTAVYVTPGDVVHDGDPLALVTPA
ncbi:biotin/lipoyl-binding carrier protein [Aestuariimicrobium ganziense]|uniref:biotin/lipoyl-binding carrier protein n=1 Tax=Aestuariimicrobium ganziense TaxID=2773677 RepID=UPI001941D685|nr:biotin/lipoyl-binding carrier protein [Aestuariimicrobium ganziense]